MQQGPQLALGGLSFQVPVADMTDNPAALSAAHMLPAMGSWAEQDPFARSVLLARMKDGLLHMAKVSEDVRQYNGKHTDAVGCGGGFPCKAGLECLRLPHVATAVQFAICHSEGVSVAGHQVGMQDARTGLVRHVFRIWDTLQPQRRSGCVHGLGFTLYFLGFRAAGFRVSWVLRTSGVVVWGLGV